jgi:hypothetical protein
VLARLERAQDVLTRGLGAAHHFDDQVTAAEDVVEVALAAGKNAAYLRPEARGCFDRRPARVEKFVECPADRSVAEEPDPKGRHAP